MIVERIDAGTTRVLAPAKVNLFLEVSGKRPDGYHELETAMVEIGLRDELTFRDAPGAGIALECDDPALPTDGRNLVRRAAEAILREAGDRARDLGVRVELRKRVPREAGLGGGSSDAAATLLGLDALWGLRTPKARLAELAAALGSDVPFFLDGPAALCRGRGELVEPLPPFGWAAAPAGEASTSTSTSETTSTSVRDAAGAPEGGRRIGTGAGTPPWFWLVLVCPPAGVPTSAVYARLEVPPPERRRSPDRFLQAWARGDVAELGSSLFNRLQPAAEALEPGLAPARDALAGPGRDLWAGWLMSGSGSTYFALVPHREAARTAARALASRSPGRILAVAVPAGDPPPTETDPGPGDGNDAS